MLHSCFICYNHLMKTTAQIVRDYMQERPFLLKYIHMGVVNYRALAQEIAPSVNRKKGYEVSIESIAASLRRLQRPQTERSDNKLGNIRLRHVLPDLRLRPLPNNTAAPEIAAKLLTESIKHHPYYLGIVRVHDTAVVLYESGLQAHVDRIIPHGTETQKHTGIVMQQRVALSEVEGWQSYPIEVLAQSGVTPLLIQSTATELLLVVSNEQAESALGLIHKALSGGSRRAQFLGA